MTNNFLNFFFKPAHSRATTLQKVSPGYAHKHGAELGKYKLQITKHKVGYDASIKRERSNCKLTVANDCHTSEKVSKSRLLTAFLKTLDSRY